MTPAHIVAIAQEATASTFIVQPAVELVFASKTLRRLAVAIEQSRKPGDRCGWCLERAECDCLNLQFGSIPK